MSTFIWLLEPSKIHYRVKFHQNLTSSFQVIGNYLIQKYENSFQGQGHGQMKPILHMGYRTAYKVQKRATRLKPS